MLDNPQVYVVDDDSGSLASIQALMMTDEFDVKAYSSAEAFLEDYDGSGDGCLILDMRLRGMSGLELQKKLIARHAPLPIIMISGHADKLIHDEAKSNGAVAVLEKPFAGSELRAWVRTAISKNA